MQGFSLFLTVLMFGLLCAIFNANAEPAKTAPQPAQSMGAGVPAAYKIGPGDHLSISVWKEEGMQQEVVVQPDGGISFPLAGQIKASGLTTEQLRQALVEKLKRYIPSPIVTVAVIQSVSNKVYVVGKVNRPGEFIATGYMDVLQALSMAGGLTPYAESDEIKVIRRTENGTKVFPFDYDEVVSGNQLESNIVLKAGDTVVVP